MRKQYRYLRSYGIAIAAVLIACLFMAAIDPVLKLTQPPYLLFLGVVSLSAFYGGRNPGIVSTLLSAVLVNYYFLELRYAWTLTSVFRLILFVFEGALISGLIGALHMTQTKLRQNLSQLKATEANILDLNQTLQQQVDELQTLSAAKLASEDRYRILVESVDEGFCLCEMLFDQAGTPVDYRFLEVNPVFEPLTGLKQVLGKTVRELVPDIEDAWFEIYGDVALTRKPIRFEQSSRSLQRCFDVYAFPIGEPQSRLFGVLFTNVTARKAVERERERFLAVSSDLQVVASSSGCFQWVSPAFERVLGWKREELTAQSWTAFVHPDDVEKSRLETKNLFSGSETVGFENRYRHKDGSYRWFLWNAHSYPDDQVLYGAAVDITERKQIEEALQQREAELRLVTNAVPALISFVDSEQRYRFNNRAYEEWFGHPAAQVCGKYMQDVLGEAAYREICPYVEQVLAGQQVTFESQLPYKEGGTRYVSATYVPRFDPLGGVEGFVTLVNDISDRKLAEAALEQSEERYRYLAESIPQLVWTADADGLLIDVNRRWTRFTGLPLTQVQMEGWAAVTHPDDVPVLSQNWAIAQRDGANYQAEGRMRRADGTYRWHLHQAVPLKNVRGKIVKWFGTATDIEDQKQLEQQHIGLLQQEQTARERAEAANRIKDEFLAVVSHELRSPLNPILGWSKLLSEGQLSKDKTRRALEVIERNARMQAQLINDLLDVSRILRGKLSLNVVAVELASTIQAALETVRLAAEAKSIQIHSRLDRDLGQVSGDPDRLQQVIWNLLSNAVKFTPEQGRIDLCLELVQRDGDDQQAAPSLAQITVTDTGKGIHPDFLPYVFERFQQEDSATTRKFGGLGLGLALARYLVELHGGSVRAESPGEGQGATFIVRLPLLVQQRSRADHPTALEKPSIDLTDLRILVVEDDDSTREFLTFLLELNGATVNAVDRASEALTQLSQFRPDVLLSDIGMPDMDGYMLMRQVRALPPEEGGQIPAIALTAYAGEIDHQLAMAAGFKKHVVKPVEPETLVAAIAELMVSRKAQAS